MAGGGFREGYGAALAWLGFPHPRLDEGEILDVLGARALVVRRRAHAHHDPVGLGLLARRRHGLAAGAAPVAPYRTEMPGLGWSRTAPSARREPTAMKSNVTVINAEIRQ